MVGKGGGSGSVLNSIGLHLICDSYRVCVYIESDTCIVWRHYDDQLSVHLASILRAHTIYHSYHRM